MCIRDRVRLCDPSLTRAIPERFRDESLLYFKLGPKVGLCFICKCVLYSKCYKLITLCLRCAVKQLRGQSVLLQPQLTLSTTHNDDDQDDDVDDEHDETLAGKC